VELPYYSFELIQIVILLFQDPSKPTMPLFVEGIMPLSSISKAQNIPYPLRIYFKVMRRFRVKHIRVRVKVRVKVRARIKVTVRVKITIKVKS